MAFLGCQEKWFHFLNTITWLLDLHIMYNLQINKQTVNWLSHLISTVTHSGGAQIGPEQGMHNDKLAEGNLWALRTSQDNVKDFINFTTFIKRNEKTIMEM